VAGCAARVRDANGNDLRARAYRQAFCGVGQRNAKNQESQTAESTDELVPLRGPTQACSQPTRRRAGNQASLVGVFYWVAGRSAGRRPRWRATLERCRVPVQCRAAELRLASTRFCYRVSCSGTLASHRRLGPMRQVCGPRGVLPHWHAEVLGRTAAAGAGIHCTQMTNTFSLARLKLFLAGVRPESLGLLNLPDADRTRGVVERRRLRRPPSCVG